MKLLYTFIGLGLSLLFFTPNLQACSCAYVETFCESQTFGTDTINTHLIIYGKKVRRENGGMRVEVLQTLHGSAAGQSLFVRDGNGADCGMFTDTFEDGKEFIFALSPDWRESQGQSGYMISICGVNVLEVESGIVKGNIAPGIKSIALEDFNTIGGCGELAPIAGGLEIRLGPVPTANEVELKLAFGGQLLGSARLINALGQELSRFSIEGEGTWEKTIDIRRFSPGIYFVEIEVLGRRAIRKILVQR
ncbi:MAG: T9SS type A sorting domain-containing protein [Saprospiraceae bacterium]|nr:T9SS type A sorting domain-containing protein [Saprospiraceae bacterium]